MALVAAASLPAQDGGLYGSGAPDDAAFVRIVNAAPGAGELGASIGDTGLGPVGVGSVTPYRAVVTGLFQVAVGERSVELVAENGAYYTIAILPDALLLFEDPEHTDPTQAQIFVYNLRLPGRARLVASERGATVLGPVDSEASEQVAVAAVPVELALRSGGGQIALGDPGLERGESYSVFAFLNADGEVEAFVEQATIATE
ncbi:MAG: alginate O-acetyltransferase AlgF [Spirochaetota bacterium]